uniref:Truncated tat protein n=1 Tax=Human immunodeficiency virus type 1 TaxID=11676 RepID=Q3S5G7_HV1|nr:truncated tat protein [Human immunodeficiency virus 1]
MKPVDPSLEP